MATDAVSVIREAYGAYAAGDVDTMLGYVDPELEWTYLDPAEEDPPPRVCHGRRELEVALRRQLGQGLTAQLEETVGNGDEVMVVVRIPGVDALRARKADDRNFDVMTVKDGRIVAIRACHDRAEARSAAGLDG
ncbi:MAG TPA: nuclear transport factor 2 family protein [Actinomycetota bacterium]